MDELQRKKKDACDKSGTRTCSDEEENIRGKRPKLLDCDQLRERIDINQRCLDARLKVQEECFGANADQRHIDKLDEVGETFKMCHQKALARGCL